MKQLALVLSCWLAMAANASEMSHHDHHHHMSSSTQSEHPPHTLAAPTDEQRLAAFPDLDGMDLRTMMDTPLLVFTQAERLEASESAGNTAYSWDIGGWLGTDMQRLWWRSEGEYADSEFEDSELQLLYGKPVARWWDGLVGLRHDFAIAGNGSRSWLAAGFQGLAPYWFETELTLFLADDGQSQLRMQFEYEVLFTQQMILQALIELNAYGQDQASRLEGAGLAATEAGLRMRYEIRREFAPYLGVSWHKLNGSTAEMTRAAGGRDDHAFIVAGIRLWF